MDPVTNAASEVRNPVDRVLEGARRVGKEYCWPAHQASDVAEAIGQLGQAVLGYEWWSFEENLMPRLVSVSEYRVELDGPWPEVVETSVRLAVAGLRRESRDKLWANLTWISKDEAHSAPPRAQ